MRKFKKNSQEKACARVSILIKLDVIDLHFFKTESPAHVFSREFCEICKNKFFTENLCATATVSIDMQVKIMTSK